jgi:hypothetical protein
MAEIDQYGTATATQMAQARSAEGVAEAQARADYFAAATHGDFLALGGGSSDGAPGSLMHIADVSATAEAEPAIGGYNHVGQFVDDLYGNGELEEDAILYRGDSRGPESIFGNGFTSKGYNDDIWGHLRGDLTDSYFIPTSKSYSISEQFEEWIYLIDNPKSGIDINKYIKGNPYPWEQEVSMPGFIRDEYIIGAYHTSNPMNIIPNPGYTGTLDKFFQGFIK